MVRVMLAAPFVALQHVLPGVPDAVPFLVGDRAVGVTGQAVVVDGSSTAQ